MDMIIIVLPHLLGGPPGDCCLMGNRLQVDPGGKFVLTIEMVSVEVFVLQLYVQEDTYSVYDALFSQDGAAKRLSSGI